MVIIGTIKGNNIKADGKGVIYDNNKFFIGFPSDPTNWVEITIEQINTLEEQKYIMWESAKTKKQIMDFYKQQMGDDSVISSIKTKNKNYFLEVLQQILANKYIKLAGIVLLSALVIFGVLQGSKFVLFTEKVSSSDVFSTLQSYQKVVKKNEDIVKKYTMLYGTQNNELSRKAKVTAVSNISDNYLTVFSPKDLISNATKNETLMKEILGEYSQEDIEEINKEVEKIINTENEDGLNGEQRLMALIIFSNTFYENEFYYDDNEYSYFYPLDQIFNYYNTNMNFIEENLKDITFKKKNILQYNETEMFQITLQEMHDNFAYKSILVFDLAKSRGKSDKISYFEIIEETEEVKEENSNE